MEQWMFGLASLVGSVAFALSGFLQGVRKDLDLMGLFIVSMLTANGGGVIRDLLVSRRPAVLQDSSAYLLVLGVVLLALLLRLHRSADLEQRLVFVISDSVGLVAFSITGALIGIDAKLPFVGVMTLAFLTATGGGILRDMLVNEVPTVLASGFYGSVALLIALALVGLDHLHLRSNETIAGLFLLAFGLRITAHFRGWHLPRVLRTKPP